MDRGRHWHPPVTFWHTLCRTNKERHISCWITRSYVSPDLTQCQTCRQCLSLEPLLRCPSAAQTTLPASPSLEADLPPLDAVVNRPKLCLQTVVIPPSKMSFYFSGLGIELYLCPAISHASPSDLLSLERAGSHTDLSRLFHLRNIAKHTQLVLVGSWQDDFLFPFSQSSPIFGRKESMQFRMCQPQHISNFIMARCVPPRS